jgi:alanyl-tRNA synthetase
MTERLYYRDSFLREFDAQVISCEQVGDRWKVTLDRTAFYPASGGQPHDTGKLGGAPVVEVEDAEGKVVHYTSAEVPAGPVHGEVAWARRLDHMQQHTGQHLLSAAFIERFKFPTVSFHLGREVSTIDLDAPSIVPRHLEEAERRVNEIIFDDRPVVIRYGTAEELAGAGVRKKVEREGVLRAIDIEGVDLQPCGGTHLARTGQAGLLLIRKLERTRDRWRIEFACGYRALAVARNDFATLTQAASLLSCGLPDVPAILTKTIEERRALYSTVKRMEDRLAELEALRLLSKSSEVESGKMHVVCEGLEKATPGYLGLLAAKIVAAGEAVALLASRETGHVVFAQSNGLGGDMGALLRETLKEFGGKGGGPKDFAQGSISEVSRAADAIDFARRLMKGQAA